MKKQIEVPGEILPDDHNLALLDRVAIKGKNAIKGLELFIAPRDQQTLYPSMNLLAEDYYQRFAPHLNCYSLSGASRISLIRKDFLKKLNNKFNNLNYDADYETHMFYDDTGQGKIFNASSWQAHFFGRPEAARRSSSIETTIPVCDEQGNPYFDTLLELVLLWCQTIKPTFGTAGFCFAYSDPPDARYTWALLQRHPGLEHMDNIAFMVETRHVDDTGEHFTTNRIKGVNWLTILCDALVDELGGGWSIADNPWNQSAASSPMMAGW